ncbi:MAG: type IV secretory system conjugative DNA transfer family protein [Collinsella sp.]|nr:type IV secretory system conjugative DNA transfer family protein [Collinsella sp.]
MDKAASTSPSALEASNDARKPYQTHAILARDRELSCDAHATGLNNNMLVIGPSGSGKTRSVLEPNLLQASGSYIIMDTKGALHREMAPYLAARGYEVQRLDFADLALHEPGRTDDAVGYNPLAFIRRDPVSGRPNQQDIISVACALCPTENNEPFWDRAAANYLACFIAYALEQLPEDEQTLDSVISLAVGMQDHSTDMLMYELEETDPSSFALELHRRARATQGADRMHASILGIIAEKTMCLGFDAARALYHHPRQVDFARMGRERIALFVTVSDIDHSLEPLTSLFISQAFSSLIREADRCPEGSLPVPVRLMLDDFANLRIPHMADILSVIRSREIWCTMLLQSTAQLVARYGESEAISIIGNCDTQIVLAFQDVDTASRYRDRANKMASSLMATPLDRAWLFVRGRAAEEVDKYDLASHPAFVEMVAARDAARQGEPEAPVGRHGDMASFDLNLIP